MATSSSRLLIWVDISKVTINPFHYYLRRPGAIGVWPLPDLPVVVFLFHNRGGLRVSLDDVLDLSLRLLSSSSTQPLFSFLFVPIHINRYIITASCH